MTADDILVAMKQVLIEEGYAKGSYHRLGKTQNAQTRTNVCGTRHCLIGALDVVTMPKKSTTYFYKGAYSRLPDRHRFGAPAKRRAYEALNQAAARRLAKHSLTKESSLGSAETYSELDGTRRAQVLSLIDDARELLK